MDITYLGHAGFYVEAEQFVLVMDPWLSPEGAFDSAWFQFPCNHHLASWLCEALRQTKKERFVYVSHEHRDHFDPDFLSKLPLQDVTFLVPRFDRPALREELTKFRPKAIVLVDHGQQISVPGGAVRLFLDDGGINRERNNSSRLKFETKRFHRRIGGRDDGPEFAHTAAPFAENISRAARTLSSSVRTVSRS